jgi:chemotaxis-related protein WspB
MLMLLLYVGDNRYALAARQVVEVMSLVELKKLARSPKYLAGLLSYRDRVIPVIDLCQLLSGTPSRPYLSTRIIVINYTINKEKSLLLGLIAERVTETLDRQDNNLIEPRLKAETSAYLGEIITDEQGMIQCIQVESLLSESQQRYLLPQLE